MASWEWSVLLCTHLEYTHIREGYTSYSSLSKANTKNNKRKASARRLIDWKPCHHAWRLQFDPWDLLDWKEWTNFQKLSSELDVHTMAQAYPHSRPRICVHTKQTNGNATEIFEQKKRCEWISFEICLVNSHTNHRTALLIISRLLKQLCSWTLHTICSHQLSQHSRT